MSVSEAKLRGLLQSAPRSQAALLELLIAGLDWPIPDGTDWGDIELPWSPEELHLDPDKVARLTRISQMPKLTQAQSFGIFVLGFEGGRLPIGAVRRLVQRLVTNQRGRTGGGRIPTWDLNDLLFFCLAEDAHSVLHVVNFREHDGKRVLRVLSWTDQLTPTRLELLLRRGVPELTWESATGPAIAVDPDYRSAFTGYRQGIRSAKALSKRMAEVAQDVRDEVTALLEVETESGPMRTLFRDVREHLLGDITLKRFADVYAQTMVYGLLTARIAHPEQFRAEQSLAAMSFDNEFLDAIYARFRDGSDTVVDVDELGLADLAEQLAATDVDELLADFGSDNQRDDPVVYFYEEFLAAYDPDQRRDLGAFYTPKPVVRYIVKAVDDALKSFGLPLGVADPTTWAEYTATRPDVEIPDEVQPEDAVVSMFDPANGTGTFLVEWLAQARKNAGEAGVEAALHHASALEISLASYAVSHLKVSLDLPDHLREEERLPIFLGDTLGRRRLAVFDGLADPISTEGTLADRVKYDRHHNVLIGNPPYDRVESKGTGGFVTRPHDGSRSLFDDIFDDARENVIFSAHASLYNLYVYFWRWAIWKTFEQNTGPAVVSMITASSWLAGPGFLGLRRLGREVADEIVVLDLGGDNKGTRKDDNVFDIETPVAIVTLVRRGSDERAEPAPVRYARVWGDRTQKLHALAGEIAFETAGAGWHDPLVPIAGDEAWASFPRLTDLLPWQQPGAMVSRTWPVAPEREVLKARWRRLLSTSDAADRLTCFAPSKTGRSITTKVSGLDRLVDLPVGVDHRALVRFGMRSFDRQWTFEDPRLAKTESPALWWSLSDRQVFLTTMTTTSLGGGPASTAATAVPDKHYFRGSFGGKDVIPLYRDARGTPNADPALLSALTSNHRAADPEAAEVTVERLFAYVFGVLAGADYTERFHEALATPGPRVPVTADPALFDQVAQHGERLLWLQTFGERFTDGRGELPLDGVGWASEPTRLPADNREITYDPVTRELRVADGALTGVPPEVWDFEVSGMVVIAKWLGYRMVKPAGKAASSKSPLDKIRPTTWSAEWSRELVEVVAVLTETLALLPAGVALLEAVLAGPLITAEELPSVPLSLRQPPRIKPGAHTQSDSEEELF